MKLSFCRTGVGIVIILVSASRLNAQSPPNCPAPAPLLGPASCDPAGYIVNFKTGIDPNTETHILEFKYGFIADKIFSSAVLAFYAHALTAQQVALLRCEPQCSVRRAGSAILHTARAMCAGPTSVWSMLSCCASCDSTSHACCEVPAHRRILRLWCLLHATVVSIGCIRGICYQPSSLTRRPTSRCTGREPARYFRANALPFRSRVRAGERRGRWAASYDPLTTPQCSCRSNWRGALCVRDVIRSYRI